MSILRRFEREIDARLRKLFSAEEGEPRGREMVEIHRGILDEVTSKVQPLRRGKRVFPYNELLVHVPVSDPDRRNVFSIAFGDGEELTTDIKEALAEAGCEPPSDLRAEIVLDESDSLGAGARGFHIVYRRRAEDAVVPEAPAVRLTIMSGDTERQFYELAGSRLNIGRMREVLDDEHRLVRRNDVIFDDSGGAVNATVSRAHAHIEFDASTREFRLFDDHSAYGTSLFRGGSLIHVPAGSGRGVALRAGDEIYFGRARARFEIGG